MFGRHERRLAQAPVETVDTLRGGCPNASCPIFQQSADARPFKKTNLHGGVIGRSDQMQPVESRCEPHPSRGIEKYRLHVAHVSRKQVVAIHRPRAINDVEACLAADPDAALGIFGKGGDQEVQSGCGQCHFRCPQAIHPKQAAAPGSEPERTGGVLQKPWMRNVPADPRAHRTE